jgi:uncharacterized protein YrrD
MEREMSMDIQLEKPVLARDGEKIGTVDRLIVDKETHKIREFLVKEGTLLTTDRIVDVELVTAIDSEGTVHISIPSSEADSLQPFVEDRYVTPAEHEINMMPHAWATGAAGGGPLFWGPAGPGRGEPGEGSMFEPASVPTGDEYVTDEPLDQASVIVDEGTNVVGNDGESLGKVDEVLYDDRGEISGFRVTSGLIFTKRIEVPIRWVGDIRPDGIQLNLPANEAESEGTIQE